MLLLRSLRQYSGSGEQDYNKFDSVDALLSSFNGINQNYFGNSIEDEDEDDISDDNTVILDSQEEKQEKSFDLVAIHSFDGEQPGDLCFRVGDKVKIISKKGGDDKWWIGETVDRRVGMFPATYTIPIVE